MMKWETLLTTKRTGQSVDKIVHDRSEFQRDYDRMVFSSPFRRLQDKTQVFPLPGSVFVHNRLTHSLEVASVGRSLGNNISRKLAETGEAEGSFHEELGSIVASACLAHDMGNPPFGHSGEKAISHYFSNERGEELISKANLNEAERSDLVNFDGNANTFRLLTHSFRGRRKGGFALTYPTIASVIKYPRSSVGTKKFGYFQQDKDTFIEIMRKLNIVELSEGVYSRYPLVYLVEAADDICYQIMDIEDACRLGILSYDETVEMLCDFFNEIDDSRLFENRDKVFDYVTDKHERIAYLRSIVIGRLVCKCSEIFWNNREAILSGTFKGSLISHLPNQELKAIERISRRAIKDIYKHQSVVEVEISGFKIMGTLLDKFIQALEKPDLYYSTLLKPFIPEQYFVGADNNFYNKALAAVDIVSGMTDVYALDLFKKIKGMGI